MSNPIVDQVISNLESGLLNAATQAGVDLKPQVLDNAKGFLNLSYTAVERWVTGYLASPQTFTSGDLKTLLEDLLEDALMHAFTLLEQGAIEVDKSKSVLFQLVTSVASSAIGKIIVP